MRKGLNMSQSLFAVALNASTEAVQGCWQGLHKPSNTSLLLLEIVQKRPNTLLRVV